jgi:hypothetical protein
MALLALALAAGAVGCGDLGQVVDRGGADAAADQPGEPPGDDPPPAVLVCRADLALTGSLTPPDPAPPGDGGCSPLGTWTVSLEIADPGDCGDVPLAASYVYQVTGGPETGYQVTYPADATSDHIFLKVTSEGGVCQGNFEHYAADGRALLLIKPFADGAALAGQAAYEEYSAPQI